MIIPTLHFAMAALVILGGLQDWRKREVSGLICEPLLYLGVVFVILRAVQANPIPLIVTILLFVFWNLGWMGGADVKILIGLWGLWPAAAFWGMTAGGLWGLVQILRRQGKSHFPAVTLMAFGIVQYVMWLELNSKK